MARPDRIVIFTTQTHPGGVKVVEAGRPLYIFIFVDLGRARRNGWMDAFEPVRVVGSA